MNEFSEQIKKISVVVAVYNNISYLQETLESIISQDYPNVEIVICDDCSTKFSKTDLLDEINKCKLSKRKIIVVRNDENIGTVKNLDNAYKLSTGDLIVNLSCGDVFTNHSILNQIVACMEKNNYSNLICSRLLCDEHLKPICEIPPKKYRNYLTKKFSGNFNFYFRIITETHYGFPSGSAFCILKNTYLENNGYDNDYLLLEDKPFFSSLAYKGILNFNFDIVSVKYRKGGVSTSKEPNPKVINDLFLYYKKENLVHNDIGFFKSRIKKDYLNFKLIKRNKTETLWFLIAHPFLTIFILKNKIYFNKMYKGLF